MSLDLYVVDTLMRDLIGHDRRPSAYLTYLAILSAGAVGGAALSHAELAERTGLSKRAVQDAVAHLARRRLIAVRRGSPGEPAHYCALRPWAREGA